MQKNALQRIPPEDAVTNSEDWTVGVQTRTAKILRTLLDDRECYEKYEDSDLLRLTKDGKSVQAAVVEQVVSEAL